MERAAFAFINYKFNKAELNLRNLPEEGTFTLQFKPNGEYVESAGLFRLNLDFKAKVGNRNVIVTEVEASFRFSKSLALEDIPPYFYPNSIAILFPYIRSFVSTLTLQANMKPIILPTMNLTSLQEDLRKNTIRK